MKCVVAQIYKASKLMFCYANLSPRNSSARVATGPNSKVFKWTLLHKKQTLLQIWTVQNTCKVSGRLIENTFQVLHAAYWGCNMSLSRINPVYSTVDTSTLQPFDIFGCGIQFANLRWPITLMFCEWPRNFATNPILLHTSVLWFSHIASSVADSCIDYTGQHKISFWDESSHPLLILGRGIWKLVLKLSVSSSFRDMGTSNIC